jgi:hypothetical protein
MQASPATRPCAGATVAPTRTCRRGRARAGPIPARCTPARRRRLRPTPAGGGWQSVGLGDCPGPRRGRHQRAQSRSVEVQRELRGQHGGVLDDGLHVQERGDGFVHRRCQSRPDVHLWRTAGDRSHAAPPPPPAVAAGSRWAWAIARAATWPAPADRIPIRRSATRALRATRRCAGRPVARTRTWPQALARAGRIPARCTPVAPVPPQHLRSFLRRLRTEITADGVRARRL